MVTKMIKFDLQLKGIRVTSFDELQEQFSADILPIFQTGRLAKWLMSREMVAKSEAIANIDINISELRQLAAICRVLELDEDEEVLQFLLDDRQTGQAAQVTTASSVADASDVDTEDAADLSPSDVDWSGQDMSGRQFIGEDLRNANLKKTNFHGANLSKTDLSGADLSGADLTEANLMEANLTGAILVGAILNSAYLRKSNLTKANLTNADLSAVFTYENKYAYYSGHGGGEKEMLVNFSDANLTDACLISSVITGANFTAANLTRANLENGKWYNANFTDANLSFANLNNLSFYGSCYMHGDARVNLTGAKLTGVINFTRPEGFINASQQVPVNTSNPKNRESVIGIGAGLEGLFSKNSTT